MSKKARLSRFSNVDTTEGVIWQKLLFFAIPILLTNFLQQLYNTIDMVIVGNYSTDTSVGAIGATGAVTNLLVAVFLGISTGTSVLVSRYYASGDYKKLYNTVHTSMFIGIVNGFFLILLGVLATDPILDLMNTPQELMPEASLYMKIIFLGMLPTSVYNMTAAMLRAVGDSKRPLLFLIFAAVSNLGLDLLFVVILDWGVAGAAWATFAAQTVSAILGTLTLMRSETPYRLFFREIKFHREESKEVLKIGLPAGLQSAVVSSANTIVQSQVNAYGQYAVQGYAAESRLNGFFFTTVNSFSLALTTFVGQNLGARKYDRVKRAVRISLLLGAGLVLALGVIVYFFRYEFLAFFNLNAESMPYGITMLTITCFAYFLFGIGDILSGALRGAGQSIYPMISALINMFVVRLLWVFIAQRIYPDVLSVFTAYPVSWLTMALTMFIIYRSGRWQTKEMKRHLQVEQ